MTVSKSMVDVAYELMSKKKRAVAFKKLWEDVSKETGADMNLVAQFYTDLTLDSRFVALKDNKWDLKNRRKFEESHIDISLIEIDDEPDEEDGEVLNEDDY